MIFSKYLPSYYVNLNFLGATVNKLSFIFKNNILLFALFIGIASITSPVKAATIYQYTATIHDHNSDEIADYYLENYGIGIGSQIDFTIIVDETRDSYIGGYYYDNCTTCYYAELAHTSFDQNILNYYEERDSDLYFNEVQNHGQITEKTTRIEVGDIIHAYEYSVYDNELDQYSEFNNFFYLGVKDDGRNELMFMGTFSLVSATPVPVPPAALMFLSGIGGCCIFRRKNK